MRANIITIILAAILLAMPRLALAQRIASVDGPNGRLNYVIIPQKHIDPILLRFLETTTEQLSKLNTSDDKIEAARLLAINAIPNETLFESHQQYFKMGDIIARQIGPTSSRAILFRLILERLDIPTQGVSGRVFIPTSKGAQWIHILDQDLKLAKFEDTSFPTPKVSQEGEQHFRNLTDKESALFLPPQRTRTQRLLAACGRALQFLVP